MITFLTLQCNLIWGDVMQAVVLVPKHSSIPTPSGNAASFIQGQDVDSSGKPGFRSGPSTCLMHVNQGSHRKQPLQTQQQTRGVIARSAL